MNRENKYHAIVSSMHRNIKYYKKMIVLSKDPYQKMFYESLLNNEIMRFNYWQRYYLQKPNNPENLGNEYTEPNQREFTLEELAQYDGSGGRPAYVAVNGIVYDVSLEATWGGGTHFMLYAGMDLTGAFTQCHGGRQEILRNLPKVGMLKG